MITCKICQKEFNNDIDFSSHLNKTHLICLLDYSVQYDNFIRPKCVECDKNALCYNMLKFKLTCGSKQCISKSRSKNVSKSLSGKIIPQSVRDKISVSRKKYLVEHPDQVPYLLNHSSKKSYPEKVFEDTLNKLGIIGWIYNYQHSVYQYDFAFPNLKIDIEIDGSTHNQEKIKQIDKERDEFSIANGWKVIRFDAKSVTHDPIECVNRVKYIIENEVEDYLIKINLPIPKSEAQIKRELYADGVKQRKIEKEEKIQQKINIILESDIDFSKRWWLIKVSRLLKITRKQAGLLVEKYMPQTYEKCFKNSTSRQS